MSVVIGFSGGGGVECGLINAGIQPTLSIELDPHKPELSNAIADVADKNFHHKATRMTVQQWAAKEFPGSDNCQYAHFSPVCCNFSTETRRGDLENDISSGMAIADFVRFKKPKIFTLENVQSYANSNSFKEILRSLIDNSYIPNIQVINFADYGVPQSRKRLFIGGVQNAFFPTVSPCQEMGWFEATKDLIPTLEETSLTNNQKAAIDLLQANFSDFYQDGLPYLIPRVGYRNRLPRLIPSWKPAPTIKRSIFDDGKGSGRNQVWTIWDGEKALNCNIEVFRRLQTFPGWYKFSGDMRVDGSIIGNSVPPLFITRMMNLVDGLVQKTADKKSYQLR